MGLFDKTNKETVIYLEQKIGETQEKQNLFLRQVGAHIEVDTALMSKAERGERNLNREQAIKLALFLNAFEDDFVSLRFCDKVIEAVGKDPLTEQGIKKVLTNIKD